MIAGPIIPVKNIRNSLDIADANISLVLQNIRERNMIASEEEGPMRQYGGRASVLAVLLQIIPEFQQITVLWLP
jgi:hypothetical protein